MGVNNVLIQVRGEWQRYQKRGLFMKAVFVLLLIGAVFPGEGAVSIYPSGHLASVIKVDKSYFDFSNYNLNAAALVELAPELNVELGVDYQPGEPISPIAWIDYTFIKTVRVQVGRFPVPFGVFNELLDPINNPMVTVPEICMEAVPTPWIDWGARIQWTQPVGSREAFSLSAYLCNGLGYGEDLRESRQLVDNNTNNAFGTRMAFISSRFGEFGASGYFGARDDESEVSLGMVGFDAHSRISLVELRGEYVAGFLSFDEGALDAIFEAFDQILDSPDSRYLSWTNGGYIHLALHLSQYAVPTLRYDYLGYEDIDQETTIMRQRFGLGVACYPINPLVVKFETGFTKNKDENALQLEPLNFQLGVSL